VPDAPPGQYAGDVFLIRTSRGEGVRGRFVLPDGTWLHTLEDRPIPPGRYWLAPDDTGRFRHWVVERAAGSRCAVPATLDCFGNIASSARDHVEIHAGNTVDDSRGCILLGMERSPAGLIRSVEAIEYARRALGREKEHPPCYGLTILDAIK